MPSRPIQPETAFLATKTSPEILDIILSILSYPCSATPSPPTRSPRRTSDVIKLGGVSHDFFVQAARYIWRNVVLTSDGDTALVQSAIETSGGRKGRVGSCIKTIYTTFSFTRSPETIVTLAASCENLLRIDAPVLDLTPLAIPITGPASIFHRLQELVILRSDLSTTFRTSDLVGLVGLKRLAVKGGLEEIPMGTSPIFSLDALVWRGEYQPATVEWILGNSQNLQLLEIRRPTADFLKTCVAQHGATLLSLRLSLQGAIPSQENTTVFETIGTCCPNLRELLLDVCPDPRLLNQLPLSIRHLGLLPELKTSLFNGNTLNEWIDVRAELIGITLWGSHARNLAHLTELGQGGSKHSRVKTQIKKAAVLKKAGILKFASEHEWPWGDNALKDYISPAFTDYRRK